MVILDAEFQFDRHKLTYFFEADRRIDFRELVSELFSLYKTRIWMQQVDTTTIPHADDPEVKLAYVSGLLPRSSQLSVMRTFTGALLLQDFDQSPVASHFPLSMPNRNDETRLYPEFIPRGNDLGHQLPRKSDFHQYTRPNPAYPWPYGYHG